MTKENTPRKPETMSEVKNTIVATKLRLPQQQEHVVRTVLAHPEIVAFGTARSVADRCVASPSTVNRVVTALGFERFKEFRQIFRQHILSIASRAGCTFTACDRSQAEDPAN